MKFLGACRHRSEAMAMFAFAAALAAPVAHADSPINFDQGVNVSQAARDLGVKEIQPFDSTTLDVPKLDRPRFRGSVHATAGSYPGLSHFESQFMTQTAAVYSRAAALRDDVRYPKLPSDIRRPLDVQWTEIRLGRESVVKGYRGLDVRDVALKAEFDAWDSDRDAFESRKAAFESDARAWKASCLSHPLPEEEYKSCEAQRSALLARRNQVNSDSAALNVRLDSLKAKIKGMRTDLDATDGQANVWSDKVEAFSNSVQGQFERRNTGSCTEDQHRGLQDAVDASCKVKRSCDPQQLSCDELRVRLALNERCAAARDEINNTCYGGGGKTHQDEADRARETAKYCKDRLTAECGGVGLSSEKAK